MNFQGSPAVTESGIGRGLVLASGARGDGQSMRVDHVFTSPTRSVQVEVRADDGTFQFVFDPTKQYEITIEEVE